MRNKNTSVKIPVLSGQLYSYKPFDFMTIILRKMVINVDNYTHTHTHTYIYIKSKHSACYCPETNTIF